MIIFRWRIYKKIKDAQALLTIPSQTFRFPTSIRNIILAAYILACLSLFYIVIDYQATMVAMGLTISAISVMFIPIILVSDKKYPLVFTTKGIVKFPYIAEFWHDITGYGWQTYADISGLPLKKHKDRRVLFIVNKGGLLWQRNLVRYSLSILGHHHVYPDAQQIDEIEKIFAGHGIMKFNTPIDAIDSQASSV